MGFTLRRRGGGERSKEINKPKSLQSAVIKNENVNAAGHGICRPLNAAFMGIASNSSHAKVIT